MATTVNWDTKVISILQADLTFISGSLYELDTDQLRKDLKALEDDEEGIPFDDTHRHNTEVTISGVVYARTIEFINGYTITFEDLQYRVRFVGSNNNISDVANINQVSMLPQNSAGLQIVQPPGIKRNTALADFKFVMRLTSDKKPALGKTVTATRSIDNTAFAPTANAAAERASGFYEIDFAASDLNGGVIAFRATAPDCDDTLITIVTVT